MRSYRLYFKLLSELLSMSKTVHCEQHILQSYVAIWRQNTRRSCTNVKQAGCLVTKCFTVYLNLKKKYSLLSNSNKDDANLCYDEYFIQELARSVEIYEK
jgi:hypothetical protein